MRYAVAKSGAYLAYVSICGTSKVRNLPIRAIFLIEMKLMKMSRGLRNNNPGNIRRGNFRYKGEKAKSSDAEFRQFESMEWGSRAMFMLLHTYELKHGCRTIRQMINRYAPPSENFTEGYIRRVVNATHILPDEAVSTLNGAAMTAIVSAMSEVENGVKADMGAVWHGWELFIADLTQK